MLDMGSSPRLGGLSSRTTCLVPTNAGKPHVLRDPKDPDAGPPTSKDYVFLAVGRVGSTLARTSQEDSLRVEELDKRSCWIIDGRCRSLRKV